MNRNPDISEKRLLEFARRHLSETFPNPKRIGCPSVEELRLMAAQPQKTDAAVSEHLTFCSPCFNEYMDCLAGLRQEGAGQRRPLWSVLLLWPKSLPVRIAAVAVVVLLLSIAGYLVNIQREAPTVEAPSRTGMGPTPVVFSPFTLDLRELSPTRAPTAKGNHPETITLPRKPLEVSVLLPIGSEEGTYQLSVKAEKDVVWTAQAEAHLVEQKITLHVKLDLAQFPPGSYTFEVESSGLHLAQPIALQSPGAEREGKRP